MRVLAIETSTLVASVAVVTEEKVEGEFYINNKLQHSVLLFPMIENLFKTLDIDPSYIDAVAVSKGPGSFTGLRIGVAAAKGFAQGRNIKFIGISSLDAMAFMQVGFDGIIVPIMDALKDNVYTSSYKFKDGKLERISDYEAISIEEVIERFKHEKVMFCGDAVYLHYDKLKVFDNFYFATRTSNYPRASALGELALLNLLEGKEDDIFTFSPLYIRKSQAEREYEKRVGKNFE